jgi:hypothetical protein
MWDGPQRPNNLGLALSSVLPDLPGGEGRESMICTVMEAAKDMPYRLLWQGLLSCGLLSTTPAIKLNHTSALKSRMAIHVSTLVYPCRLSGPAKHLLRSSVIKSSTCLAYIYLQARTNICHLSTLYTVYT